MSAKVFLLVAFGVLGARGLCTEPELRSVASLCIGPRNAKFAAAFEHAGTQCERDLITDDLCSAFTEVVKCANEKKISDTECRPHIVEQINQKIGIPCKIEDFVAKCKNALH